MRIFVITYLTLVSSFIFATGPSSLVAIINPIAINDSGLILCKTKYSPNELGAHKEMDIFYGYCIVSKDTIIEFEFDTLIADESIPWEILTKRIEIKDSIFKNKLNLKNLNWLELQLMNKYRFTIIDLTIQKRVIQLNELTPQLLSTRQRTIKGAQSNQYESQKILITFESNHFIFLQNKIQIEDTEDYPMYGASFDFENFITVNDGSLKDVGFDLFNVTGILIKKN